MHFDLTIVIPVFNEADNLLRLENELKAYITIASVKTKVLFVDDGSLDNSLEIIQAIVNRNTSFSYICFKKNQGLSAAIKAGFDYANSSLIGYMDADLQTSPKDFNLLLAHIKDYDLVNGVRINRQDSKLKNVSSIVANRFRRFFTRDEMDDTGCPLKIIKSDYAKRMPMFKGLHRFLPAMVLLQNGTIKQIPVKHYSRTAGKSKFGLWNRLMNPLIDCFAYLWMKKNYINYSIRSEQINE